MTPTATPPSSQVRPNYTVPLIIIGVLFFTFGYVTWTNGVLIPFLKIVCNLKEDWQAFLVTSAFYMAFTFLAIPSSAILRKTGFKNGMIVGLGIVALGSLIFIPAAQSRTFGLFLVGLFVQAMGITLLQTATNPYASILGPIESAAKRISILGICNKSAGILVPLILGAIILSDADTLESQLAALTTEAQRNVFLDDLASRIIMPYVLLAGFLVLVAILIRFSPLPDLEEADDELLPDTAAKTTAKTSVLQFPNLVLGVMALFLYVGAEVIAGDAIGQFGRNLGISLDEAKHFTSYTMAAMLVGYVVGIIAIPRFITQEKALTYSAILGLILTALSIFSEGYTTIYLMAAMGLANALMWPAIFPMGIRGLGRFTKIGSALLIMGISGGAVLPLIFAQATPSDHPQQGFWVVGVCYLFILYYAVAGHKKKSW
ncbi:sugar MFS transporter [Spirosoma sp. KUDC1026]|uniref:sugar MFS transporter n=1 Tax=Spirosoma sp. KUDC1026 TaxID=2745947 RepID=UPI00159BE1B3|nr:sugar MFS transporter [Spirosoma sp. KUDC1026]QKZ13156.1 sugar MFS transporter [Spirosoma sp. KUDC1026]